MIPCLPNCTLVQFSSFNLTLGHCLYLSPPKRGSPLLSLPLYLNLASEKNRLYLKFYCQFTCIQLYHVFTQREWKHNKSEWSLCLVYLGYCLENSIQECLLDECIHHYLLNYIFFNSRRNYLNANSVSLTYYPIPWDNIY